MKESDLSYLKDLLEKNARKNSECIEWTGKINQGYGYFWYKKREWRVHRVAYEINKGEIPKGSLICHTCNNRKCINPSHLYAGSHKDNSKDLKNRSDYIEILQRNKEIRKKNKEHATAEFLKEMNGYLTVREFAKIMHVHPNTIINSIRSNHILAIRTGIGIRSGYRIHKSEFERLGFENMNDLIEKVILQRNDESIKFFGTDENVHQIEELIKKLVEEKVQEELKKRGK